MYLNIQAEEMRELLFKLFLQYHFTEDKALTLAKVYAENTLSGVSSHGINRVPLFIEYVKKGIVKTDADAQQVGSFGSMERWDGHLGPGIINAITCTKRSVFLAKNHGMGLVALRNTNHWMRGGTYGWLAADEGCISILFTNTQPNMPPWGGKDSRVGNNPLVISIPREQGHVVLDMSLSQFSFGKINEYKLKGEKLPFPGGWDDQDELTNDPEKILAGAERGLPIGYWKGSALSMVLDMLATVLSAGNSTSKIEQSKYETGISQVYLCIYPELFHDQKIQEKLLNEIIAYTQDVEPMEKGGKAFYPGERTLDQISRNLRSGIRVNAVVWEKVLNLMK